MEWKEVTLGEITNLVIDYRGKTPLKLGSSWSDSGYRALSAKNIKTGQIVAEDSIRFVDEELYRKWMKDEVKRGDILITSEAPFGQIYYWDSDEKIVLSQRLFDVRLNDEVCHKYVYYFMTSHHYQKDLEGRATGTTVTGLRQPELLKSTILLPPLSAQRSIASILSSLDRKIELNNKINADLEEMAQAIFKNWFVDFEPFKDGEFVDSELGMIPEGWKVVVFDNILKVTTTKTGKEGIPEYSVTNTGIHPRDEKFTKNLSKSSAKNKLIRKGNLVFGMSREILNWGIMKEEVGGVSSAYNVYIVDEKIVNTTYLECFIAQRMDYFADLIKPASREGQGVDKALLMKKIICIPPSEVMDVFLEKYNSIMHLTEIRNQENTHLSLLRDTLLPRLMSGELEVPE